MRKFLTLFICVALSINSFSGWIEINKHWNIKKIIGENQQTNLNSIIKQPNLGDIAIQEKIPSKKEILKGIIDVNNQAKILTVNDFIFKDVATNTGCVIIGIGEYTGMVMLQYSKLLTDLKDIIVNPLLNSIVFSNNMLPSKEDLLVAIKRINPLANYLTVDDFVIVNTPTIKSTDIMGINNFYNTIKLTYTKQNMPTDLNKVIITTNLGFIIFNNGLLPSKKDLLTAIISVNATASKLLESDFMLNDTPTSTSCTIIGINKYQGSVLLNYTQKNAPIDITTLITVTNLGKISIVGILPPTKTQLLARIKEVNDKAKILSINDFALLDNPSNTSATIYGIGNNFKGSVTLTYRIL